MSGGSKETPEEGLQDLQDSTGSLLNRSISRGGFLGRGIPELAQGVFEHARVLVEAEDYAARLGQAIDGSIELGRRDENELYSISFNTKAIDDTPARRIEFSNISETDARCLTNLLTGRTDLELDLEKLAVGALTTLTIGPVLAGARQSRRGFLKVAGVGGAITLVGAGLTGCGTQARAKEKEELSVEVTATLVAAKPALKEEEGVDETVTSTVTVVKPSTRATATATVTRSSEGKVTIKVTSTPKSTDTPTSRPTDTPLPTKTPEPTMTITSLPTEIPPPTATTVSEVLPGVPQPDFFLFEPYSQIMGLKPEDLEISYRQTTDYQGNPLVIAFNTIQEGQPFSGDYPLLIFDNFSQSWKEYTLEIDVEIDGVTVGAGLTGPAKYHRDVKLQETIADNFGLVRFTGQLRPDKIEEQPARYEAAQKISSFANRDKIALHLIPGLWPRYFKEALHNADGAEIDRWTDWFIDKYLDLVRPIEQSGSPAVINFASEVIYWSQRHQDVRWYTNKEDCPLFTLYGERWPAIVYKKFKERAEARDLVLGKDFYLSYSDNLFMNYRHDPGFTLNFYESLVRNIAEELNIPVEEVELDAAIELHCSLNPDQDYPYIYPPTDEEFATVSNELKARGVKRVRLIEFDVKSATEEQKLEILSRGFRLSKSMGFVSIELWNPFLFEGDPNSPFGYGPNGLFNPDLSKTKLYYRLVKEIYSH